MSKVRIQSQVLTPECARCQLLMRWHSEHQILDRDRSTRMQVFQCGDCERLSAQEGYYGPAG